MTKKGWGAADLRLPLVVYQLSLRLGVSYRAMVWSLKRINFLSQNDASQIVAVAPKALKEAASPDRSAPAERGDVWVLDSRDQEFVIEPRAGDRFILRLPNHAGAGYVWKMDDVASAGFSIQPVVVDPSKAIETAPVVVGGGGSIAYELQPSDAAAAAEAVQSVKLEESQPWNTASSRDTVGLRAQYETLANGLSPGSRQRHLQGPR